MPATSREKSSIVTIAGSPDSPTGVSIAASHRESAVGLLLNISEISLI